MSTTYKNHWNGLLAKDGTQAIDVLISAKQETFNEFLRSHFEYDNKHYTLPIKRTFDANGKQRTFWLTVKVEKPIVIGFPPFPPMGISKLFSSTNSTSWTELDYPAVVHRVPKEDATIPNIQITCPKISLLLQWEKLDGTGKWDLQIDPIEAIAEGFLEIILKDEGSFIKIHPTRVYFEKAGPNFSSSISKALQNANSDFTLTVDEMFRDLVVIMLNIAATEATPNFIREIPIPSAAIKDKKITLSYLDLSKSILTIGATLDAAAQRQSTEAIYRNTMGHFNFLLDEDVKEAGGLEAFFDSDKKILPPQEIDKKLPRVTNLIKDLEVKNVTAIAKLPGLDATTAGTKVPEGIAIGFNEYLLDTLANSSLPNPTDECTGWEEFLTVRGRACWWSHVSNADTSIVEAGSGFKLSGSVALDVGGALDGCVKRFWDCSWRWTCERFGLALRDRPEIAIELKDDGRGILLKATIIKMPKLEADLPFPFNKVVEFFGEIIIRALKVILNMILSQITLRIVPGDIALPIDDSHTGFRLSDFDAFYFKRPDTPFGGKAPSNKLAFGAYAVSVQPRKI